MNDHGEALVSSLAIGDSVTICEPVQGKPEEPPRNKITYTRRAGCAVRDHVNYFGVKDQEVIDLLTADLEADGFLVFHDYEIVT